MTHKLINQPWSTLKSMTCKRCGDNEDRVQGYCSNHCKELVVVDELREENKRLKEQLWTLAEDAGDMLTLLIDNKPIDGLYLSSIEEWDWKIKEVIK